MLFAVGALLHDFHPELAEAVRHTWPKALMFVLGLLLCVIPQRWLNLVYLPGTDGIYWHMLGATLLVWSVLHWPLLQSVLGSAPGRLLGRISFVLYLIHVPIICSLTAWMIVTFPGPAGLVGAAATTTVVAFALSIAIYRYVDQIPTQWSRSAGYLFDSILGAGSGQRPQWMPERAN